MDEICSHAFAALSEGDLIGEEVECPLHRERVQREDRRGAVSAR